MKKEEKRCYIAVFCNGDTIKHCCTGQEMLKKINDEALSMAIECCWIYEVQNNNAKEYSYEDFSSMFYEEENENE